jgi:hypothetical protein
MTHQGLRWIGASNATTSTPAARAATTSSALTTPKSTSRLTTRGITGVPGPPGRISTR